MVQQLLWIEVLLKLAGGVTFALFPLTAAKVLGLPAGGSGFWPRLLGAMLIGLAGAAFIEGRATGAGGLGMAGAVVINLVAAGMLVALLVFQRAAVTWRGKALLWMLAAALVVLGLVEISVA